MRGQDLGSEYSLRVCGGAAQRESGGEGAPGSRGEGEAGATQQSWMHLLTYEKAYGHWDDAAGEVPHFLQGYEIDLKNWWKEQSKSRSDSWCSLLGACDQ